MSTMQWKQQLPICSCYKNISIPDKSFWSTAYPVWFGNISKDCSVNDMKETGINGYV